MPDKTPPAFASREEIVFLYDATNSNPNGDPDQANRPREDPTTGKILVTDLRVKRTIRDYIDLHVKSDGCNVLVKRDQSDDLSTMEMDDLVYKTVYGNDWPAKKKAYEDLSKKKKPSKDDKDKVVAMIKEIRDGLLKNAIDVRAFGAVTTLNNYPWTFTGPVQFSLGMSLNIPVIREIPISPIVATKAESMSGSLGDYKVVDYALIAVPGIACPVLAKKTSFNGADLALIYEALWRGTMALQSRSKANQVSRLLMAVVSKNEQFQAGGLSGLLKIPKSTECTGIADCPIEIEDLVTRLKHFENKIEKIKVKVDPDVKVTVGGKPTTLKDALDGFTIVDFPF